MMALFCFGEQTVLKAGCTAEVERLDRREVKGSCRICNEPTELTSLGETELYLSASVAVFQNVVVLLW